MDGIIGRKLAMTQVFGDTGSLTPVTVIEAGPCPVVGVKTPERDGYGAVVLGFGETSAILSIDPHFLMPASVSALPLGSGVS